MWIIPVMASLLWCFGFFLISDGIRGTLAEMRQRCWKCGYDLTGIVEKVDRCPECGEKLGSPQAMWTATWRSNRPLIAWGAIMVLIGVGVTAVSFIWLV
jgi:hypothetical protein